MGDGKNKKKLKSLKGEDTKKNEVHGETATETENMEKEPEIEAKNTKPNVFDIISDFFTNSIGISTTGKEDIEKIFESLKVFASSGIIFVVAIKILIYWEARGRFSVYHISNDYIRISENSLFELLVCVAIIMMIAFLNMMYVALSTQNFEKCQTLKRIISILFLWFIEIIVVCYFFFILGDYGPLDMKGVASEIRQVSPSELLRTFVILAVYIVLMHVFAMII